MLNMHYTLINLFAGHDLRQECAPFTEPYFRYISDNTARIKSGHAFYKHMALTLSKQEVEAGWVLRDKVGTA